VLALLFAVGGEPAFARDAAFLEPGASGGGGGSSEEAIKVDPKAEIDVGETTLSVAKRVSVFFVNQTNAPVKIEKVVVNSDSNVTAEATANDCTKQGTIEASSRCSVEISVTAVSPGSWSVDVLMTHNGAGRITRARLTGKTSGVTSSDNKSSGLAVNAKETKPVDFGEISVGDGKIVRSTLMINDSAEPITIYSIDVIEADNGLQRLDQGCAVDMELAPGASCPVTLLWVPKSNGPISTDLIIRHSGRLGFAVIPVRGMAKGPSSTTKVAATDGKKEVVPLPPSVRELESEMVGKVTPVSSATLENSAPIAEARATGDGSVHLIGTIGERALLLTSTGDTIIIAEGGEFAINGKSAKIVAVKSRSIDYVVGGVRKTLPLEASSMLVDRAAKQNAQESTATTSAQKGSGGAASSVPLNSGSTKK
jgi:hypothetical protein